MRRELLLPLILVSCDTMPSEPRADAGRINGELFPAITVERPAAVITVPNERVSVTIDGSDAGPIWFRADVRAAAEESSGGAGQMDGAILVVSAVDGRTPQIEWSLQVVVTEARLGADGVVRFLGEGTLTRARDDITTFAVSGSAQAAPPPVDTLIWDILGGGHAYHVTAGGKLVLTGAAAGAALTQ